MDDLREYINKLRHEFTLQRLDELTVDPDPVKQFGVWFREAADAQMPDPNAFVLSTASAQGRPSARVLLLRNFSEEGFAFYTNYHSRKGKEIEENPYAAMTFFWQQLERQVRIEGILEKQSDEESDLYFSSRPAGSRIGAWVSLQSQVIASRKELDIRFEELQKEYEGKEVPRPAHWGGYWLKPQMVEFWQGRPSRLHDRIVYHLENGEWSRRRLAP
jgi:pyridoxamine 5'-phosphate oxidase